MSGYFILAILALAFVVTFQIAKASEYVSVLKGEEKAFRQNNRINAFMFIAFLVLGLAGAWWCNELFYDRTLLAQPAASDHGEKIDLMLWITIIVTGIVFLLTQVLLFWFAFKYQYKETRSVYYFPHNNKLELIWTVVPAIFLTVLVGFGLFYWFKITGDAPKDSQVVEITGKQFNWMVRYPGKDNVLGRKNYRLTDASNGNALGVDWEDAQDVIHDVGLVHFRLKMDAVPGIPTTLWFTPKYTTTQMKEITGNKDFVYEISCDQMCGSGHYSMRGVIIVETQEEYDAWISSKKSQYATVKEAAAPAAPAAASADSTAVAAVMNTKPSAN
jgi:cytochrome c oxidase subunit 2